MVLCLVFGIVKLLDVSFLVLSQNDAEALSYSSATESAVLKQWTIELLVW